MMYIDQAPLGGNLVNIIKKSASLSNAAATPTEGSVPLAKELNCQEEPNKRKSTVNGEHSLANGNHEDLSQAYNDICKIIQNTKSQLQAIDKERKQREEEEEETEEDKASYELYDIEPDTEEQVPQKEAVQETPEVNAQRASNLTNGFNTQHELPSDIKNNREEATTSRKRTRETYETEDDCQEFIIQIKPVPKLNAVKPKQRRPLPAALPIADFIAKSEKRVLNNCLTRSDVRAYEREDPAEIEEYRFVQSSSIGDELVEPFSKQMGINILSSIWKNIFQSNSKAANTEQETGTGGSKRKRSFGFSQTKAVEPPQIKYRRVENNFPKIITGTLDNDLDNFPAYQQRLANRARLASTAAPLSFEMTHQGESGSISQRRSLFELPQKVVVRNTSYADYEFSDDEDEDCTTRRIKKTLGTLSPKSVYTDGLQHNHQPKVRNIPIHIEQTRPPMFMPPLANTSYMLDSMRPPTYADILKQSTLFGHAHILGRHAGSSNNSSGDGASSSRFDNALGKASSRINPKGIGGSILRQERAKVDHENYKQLLEKVTSRVSRPQSLLFPSSSRPQSRNTTLLNLATATSNSKKKSHLLSGKLRTPLPSLRAPLSSTINIDDDNDAEDIDSSSDEVVVTGISHLNSRAAKASKRLSSVAPHANVLIDVLDDDDEVSEIIDLESDEQENAKSKRKTAKTNEIIDLDAKENEFDDLPYVEPVNSFRDYLQTPALKDDWFQTFSSKWEQKVKTRKEEVGKTVEVIENTTSGRRAFETDLRLGLQQIYIVDPELLGVDDFEKPEAEEVPEFPELDQARIKAAVCGPPDQVLIEKFNFQIKRRDIHTLLGLNWLNDEVINFYMSLITDRSDQKHKTHGYPKVYAMNTFFLQRLMQSGHGGVKRWTRKVNIFEKDIIPVPVHVGGVHWCMAIIHMKNRWIRYYDSMGSPNPNALRALEQYLKDESLDKRKQPFDTSDFVIESVADVPRQQNGSDCGVFSCMFAEYTSRNKPITFEQKHMEYFRHKMIWEIVRGELLL